MGIFSSRFGNIEVNNLSAESFAEKINQHTDAVILDVRTLKEHSSGRIPNSLLVDIHKASFRDEIEKLDRTKSYFIYCRSGNRSTVAAYEMLEMGFKNVYNLENGFLDWRGDVEKG